MSPHSLSSAVFPDEKQVQQAAKAVRQLAVFRLKQSEISRIELICDEGQREMLVLPATSLGLLGDILGEIALGNAVKIVAIQAELTTQEAANLLNVSRPYLVKLLDSGALPHIRTAHRRRIKFADLMIYKERRDQASYAAIDELTAQAQELGMGYE
jgi:excisionase family DNA binding protein